MAGSHAPIPVDAYFRIHETIMDDFCASGVIQSHTLNVDFESEFPLVKMKGKIFLRDGLRIRVMKILRITDTADGDYIHTESYSYNVSQSGRGNVFRYDNSHPHPGHISKHHYHEWEKPGAKEHPPIEIEDGKQPTLGQVITQADNYYWTYIHPVEITQFAEQNESGVNDP